MVVKIYKMDTNPLSRAVMMIGDILNLEMELIDVNLLKKEQMKPEYIKKNPLHTVPLVEDGDLYIHNNSAAMMYLVDKYGKDDSIYPKDIAKRAEVNKMLIFTSGILFPRIRLISVKYFVLGQNIIPKECIEDVDEAFAFLEVFLTRSKYMAGNNLTIADIATFPIITSAFSITPIDKYPKIKDWVATLEKESFAKKYNESGSAAFKAMTSPIKAEGT